VAELETEPKSSLYGVARYLIVFGTLGTLAYLAVDLLSLAFRLGTRIGIRSAVGIALPILAGSYAFVVRRDSLRRIRKLPASARFFASVLAGALTMASIRFFLVLLPFPVAELLVASCIAVLAFASGSFPGLALDAPTARSDRPLTLFLGVATGMLLYIVVFGVPRVVP